MNILKRKFYKYYLKFILRPIKTKRLLFFYFYSRIALFLFIRGIQIPGFQKIKRQMNPLMLQKFERKKLIHDIKSQRYGVHFGPFWFRSTIDKILGFFQTNQFLILILFKITISIICISIPIYLFILVRGILPVPERVPYEQPHAILNKSSNLHVDFPYTEDSFSSHMPKGLRHFGIGFFPIKLNVLRGFLVSENEDLVVQKIRSHHPEGTYGIEESKFKSYMRISTYLFPSVSSKQNSCVLQIFNSRNELLAQTTSATPNVESYSKYSLRNSWRRAFTPNVIPNYGPIGELQIALSEAPEKLFIKAFHANPSPMTASESQCVFMVSDFSFEHGIQKALPRRGVIFIMIDSLRANTAYDTHIMPKLNEYMKNGGVIFLEHRAQSNTTRLSVPSLLTSRYPQELDENNNLTMPIAFQNLGYRVGAIGSLSSFTEAVPGGVDMGFHNAIVAEHPRYDGRHITEIAGQWLEKYGQAPFFLYLHYNTMDSPYKPPFANLNFGQFIKNPFGLNQKRQLYSAVARYLDKELQMLFQKLKDLGIFEAVDIILTSDHGVQMERKEWDYFEGVENGFKGGYALKGHSLFDEEIRVPLMMKIADHTFPKNTKVEIPTAHLDLFPTLYTFMGGRSKILGRGLDFSQSLSPQNLNTPFSSILSKRNFLFMDAYRYSGVLAWGVEGLIMPIKYIRQFEPDTVMLYLTKTPWKKKIKWSQPELYSRINFNGHQEEWLPSLESRLLYKMRKIYFQNSISDKVLKLTSKYDGNFKFKIVFANFESNQKIPQLINTPETLKITTNPDGLKNTFTFAGNIHKNDAITINLKRSKIVSLIFEKSITPIACADGIVFSADALLNALQNNLCPYFPPSEAAIERNFAEKEKPVMIQMSLFNEI